MADAAKDCYRELRYPLETNEMGTAIMPRRKKENPGGEPGEKGGRTTAPIQIEMELARMAAVIASHDGITVSKLMSPVVRQFLLTNYERVQREIQARISQMRAEDSR